MPIPDNTLHDDLIDRITNLNSLLIQHFIFFGNLDLLADTHQNGHGIELLPDCFIAHNIIDIL